MMNNRQTLRLITDILYKFGADKLVGGDEFSSVAQGLALMGAG
jgi:hypothetical protein